MTLCDSVAGCKSAASNSIYSSEFKNPETEFCFLVKVNLSCHILVFRFTICTLSPC